MRLEVLLRDAGEDPGEPALDRRLLLEVARLHEDAADLRPRRVGHLLDADDEHDTAALRLDEVQPLMDGGGARGAGVLDPGRGPEAELPVRLPPHRRLDVLRRAAAVLSAHIASLDIAMPPTPLTHS